MATPAIAANAYAALAQLHDQSAAVRDKVIAAYEEILRMPI